MHNLSLDLWLNLPTTFKFEKIQTIYGQIVNKLMPLGKTVLGFT